MRKLYLRVPGQTNFKLSSCRVQFYGGGIVMKIHKQVKNMTA